MEIKRINIDELLKDKDWFEPGPLYKLMGFIALRYNKENKHKLDGIFSDGRITYGIYPINVGI